MFVLKTSSPYAVRGCPSASPWAVSPLSGTTPSRWRGSPGEGPQSQPRPVQGKQVPLAQLPKVVQRELLGDHEFLGQDPHWLPWGADHGLEEAPLRGGP